MEIRPETSADRQAIFALTTLAFGAEGEAKLVDNLRADGDLALSLVAEKAGIIIGHIALSKLKSPVGAMALAPISVSPDHQRQGIGSALIKAAIKDATNLGYPIIFVLGDPAYYTKFGFSTEVAAPFPSPYAGPYFMGLLLTANRIDLVEITYSDSFSRL